VVDRVFLIVKAQAAALVAYLVTVETGLLKIMVVLHPPILEQAVVLQLKALPIIIALALVGRVAASWSGYHDQELRDC
jgi:hypothetical protein